jgi:hypothetical protein
MGLMLANERAEVFCSTCKCLGFSNTHSSDKVQDSSLIVLSDRSFEEFSKSAKEGCCFCDAILQAFMLFQFVDIGMHVELLLYGQSPAELHASVNEDIHEVVEIYCPSKLALL